MGSKGLHPFIDSGRQGPGATEGGELLGASGKYGVGYIPIFMFNSTFGFNFCVQVLETRHP